MILPTDASPAPHVHLPPLRQPHHAIDPLPPQQSDLPIGAIETIRQDDIPTLQRGIQAMEEHGLAALLTLGPPDGRRQDRATGQ
jgi:hypothetical protein